MATEFTDQLYERQYDDYRLGLRQLLVYITPWVDTPNYLEVLAQKLISCAEPRSKAQRQALMDFLVEHSAQDAKGELCKTIVVRQSRAWLRQAIMMFPRELTEKCLEAGVMNKLDKAIEDLERTEAVEFLNNILLNKPQGRDMIDMAIRRAVVINAGQLMEKHPRLAGDITQEARNELVGQLGHGGASAKIRQQLLEIIAQKTHIQTDQPSTRPPKI